MPWIIIVAVLFGAMALGSTSTTPAVLSGSLFICATLLHVGDRIRSALEDKDQV